jgi:hypothetical protein
MAKKPAARKRRKSTARPVLARKKATARRTAPKRRRPATAKPGHARARTRPVRRAVKRVARRPAARPTVTAAAHASRLERDRRQLSDTERLGASKPMSDSRMISAARTGHDDLRSQLRQHTETSPTLTAGDVDAKWQDAYAVGDEAPGGDNPTPDQDRVDDIGKALGVQYQDNEELQGGDEITARDAHRWELDPASSDDWPHKDDQKR